MVELKFLSLIIDCFLVSQVQEQEKAKLVALKKLFAESADMAKIKDKIKVCEKF